MSIQPMNLNLSELGKKSAYSSEYNPHLLFPIPRALKRAELGIDSDNPGFYGVDIWTHYEVSWLNSKGKPMVAIGEISYPAHSEFIIESKSMKLYFNSLNNTKLNSIDELINILTKDLSNAVGTPVKVKIIDIDSSKHVFSPIEDAHCLDNLDIECDIY
ncbi:MAG: NADPH-dependent 7-cyano-7-deazaguanine reductase QueF, partial [Neisseriaceae bacterium]